MRENQGKIDHKQQRNPQNQLHGLAQPRRQDGQAEPADQQAGDARRQQGKDHVPPQVDRKGGGCTAPRC